MRHFLNNAVELIVSLFSVWTRSYIHEDMRTATLCSRMYISLKNSTACMFGMEAALKEQQENSKKLRMQFTGEYKLDQHSQTRFVAGDQPFKFTTSKIMLDIGKKWVESMELDRIYRLDMKRVHELETEYMNEYASIIGKWTMKWMCAKGVVLLAAIVMHGIFLEWNNSLYGLPTIIFLIMSALALKKMADNLRNEWVKYVEILAENFHSDVCKTSTALQAQKEKRDLMNEIDVDDCKDTIIVAL